MSPKPTSDLHKRAFPNYTCIGFRYFPVVHVGRNFWKASLCVGLMFLNPPFFPCTHTALVPRVEGSPASRVKSQSSISLSPIMSWCGSSLSWSLEDKGPGQPPQRDNSIIPTLSPRFSVLHASNRKQGGPWPGNY